MVKIPLNKNTIGNAEKKALNKVFDSGYMTMGKVTKEFEKKFAEHLGVKHAIYVNSGSSANLLAFSAIQDNDKFREKKQKNEFLKPGDEIIVPAVTWSTSIWPIAQTGAKAVFVDSEPDTLQMKVSDIKKAITKKTRAICMVHVLGNAGYINEVKEICKKKKLWLIEDTCESLGVKNKNKYLGTFGDIGTFSFYFSHHITTVEGGMIVTNNDYIANKIMSLRSHGWTRDMKNSSYYEKKFPDIDPRFLFVNVGYNLRSTDMNAAIGLVQLKKLEKFNQRRHDIGKIWNEAFKGLQQKKLIQPMKITKNTKASWFGFPIICETQEIRDNLRIHLEKNGIETRPIICGNMTKQPGIKNIKYRVSGKLVGADIIMDRGIFWGSSPDMTKSEVNYVIKVVNKFFS
ncbi:MAG: DegT/DnrJ/EryC1/StrS family aminotransferase [Gammaproteobacteria bacterium]